MKISLRHFWVMLPPRPSRAAVCAVLAVCALYEPGHVVPRSTTVQSQRHSSESVAPSLLLMSDAVRRCMRCQPVMTASLVPKDIILTVAQAARGSALAVMLQLCVAWRDALAPYAESMWISLLRLEMPDLNEFHTRITWNEDQPDELRRLATWNSTAHFYRDQWLVRQLQQPLRAPDFIQTGYLFSFGLWTADGAGRHAIFTEGGLVTSQLDDSILEFQTDSTLRDRMHAIDNGDLEAWQDLPGPELRMTLFVTRVSDGATIRLLEDAKVEHCSVMVHGPTGFVDLISPPLPFAREGTFADYWPRRTAHFKVMLKILMDNDEGFDDELSGKTAEEQADLLAEVGVWPQGLACGLLQEGELGLPALDDMNDTAAARYLHNDAPWPHNLSYE